MAKLDPRVDAFIAKSAPFARPILEHLRALVHEACPETEETVKWGMPTFLLDGKILFLMAAFKKHCAFVVKGEREQPGADTGKSGKNERAMGSLGRITTLDDLPSPAALKKRMKLAIRSAKEGAPARPRPAKRAPAPLEVPDDLAAALKKNRAAATFFEKLAPGYRKEYVLWITEAKRPETRASRLATTIEWLAEGKKRNWKYENC